MTIDEAIQHCEEVASKCVSSNNQCALDHRQLAEWLRELKMYRMGLKKQEPQKYRSNI